MKTLLSLFDYTGAWSKPFEDNGWNVIRWDIQTDEFMDLFNVKDASYCFDVLGWESVDGIIAALPCTDFAASGAKWFAEKDRDGRTDKSIELTRQVLRIVDLYKPTDIDVVHPFFWCIENPVGRLGRLFPELPKPIYFHPYEFAGWVDLDLHDLAQLKRIKERAGKLTVADVEFIMRTNRYTKKTGLWGEFNPRLTKKPLSPIKHSTYGSVTMTLGGKSDKTKNIRSQTPEGFAKAFYAAQANIFKHDE